MELIIKSRSPSPSISAKTAPVTSRLEQMIPDWLVISSNFQLPKLRYKRLPPASPLKKRSHQPSPSISPAATPEPLGRMVLVRERDSGSKFVNQMPVCWGDKSVKPGLPAAGTVSGRKR